MSNGYTAIQVRSNCVLSYFQHEGSHFSKNPVNTLFGKNLPTDRLKAYSGKLSDGAKKRLGRAIDLLVQVATPQKIRNPTNGRYFTHRLSFITLTVSSTKNMTAREAYDKLLSPMLLYFRRSCRMTTYVWKAEVQKRGQIHYHITTPTYIQWRAIRDKWNYLQQAAGVIDDYRAEQLAWHHNGFTPRPEFFKKWPLAAQQKAYEKGMAENWTDPNSTDIHKVQSVQNLSGYLQKEFCKTIQNPDTVGKIWDCSLNLKKFRYFALQETAAIHMRLQELEAKGLIYLKYFDQCTVIELPRKDITQLMDVKKIQEYDSFKKMIIEYVRKPKPEIPAPIIHLTPQPTISTKSPVSAQIKLVGF